MIHVLFLPGSFGSTVYYMVKEFSQEFKHIREIKPRSKMIASDGSMHTYRKTGHWHKGEHLHSFIDVDLNAEITSPVYPMTDYTAEQVISFFSEKFPLDKYIFLYVDDMKYAEINMLAQYYKIANGAINISTMSIFCGDNSHNIKKWNPDYTNWADMKKWELREWLSIFYPVWVSEWINARTFIEKSWLAVSTRQLLTDPKTTFKRIIEQYTTFDQTLESEFEDFVNVWRGAQQYLVDEYELIEKIVDCSINKEFLEFKELNIISEAIIQQKLRSRGYEIRCYDLDSFPSNTLDMNALLEKL